MERIDRRVPIKVIAQELGVSETRINQHIRALKNIFDAESLGELVECYRAQCPESQVPEENIEKNEPLNKSLKGFSEDSYSKKQVAQDLQIDEQGVGDDPGRLVFNDAMPITHQAPWLGAGEPRVVPRVLDGEYAIWFRLAAIMGIAFGILAAVVLTVTAAVTVSEALDGRATVPVDEQGFS